VTATPSSILYAGASGVSTYANTITPSANSLIILHMSRKDVASTASGHTITTSAPTFTERLDTTTTTATDVSCTNASGLRPESTATGDSSVTWSTGTSTGLGIQVGVPEAVSGPANLKSFVGTAKASVKSIDGTAIASVKTFDGTS